MEQACIEFMGHGKKSLALRTRDDHDEPRFTSDHVNISNPSNILGIYVN